MLSGSAVSTIGAAGRSERLHSVSTVLVHMLWCIDSLIISCLERYFPSSSRQFRCPNQLPSTAVSLVSVAVVQIIDIRSIINSFIYRLNTCPSTVYDVTSWQNLWSASRRLCVVPWYTGWVCLANGPSLSRRSKTHCLSFCVILPLTKTASYVYFNHNCFHH